MGSVAYLAAMMIIISTNDNEPNNAAYILLFYDAKHFAFNELVTFKYLVYILLILRLLLRKQKYDFLIYNLIFVI